MVNTVLTQLNELFDDESKVLDLLKKSEVCHVQRAYKDKSYWYQESYSVIIERFEETKGIDLKKCWIERVAWVFSWVAAIPAGGFNKEAMKELSILEDQFRGTSLEGQFVVSAQHHISFDKQGEVLLNSQDGSVLVPMKQFVVLADQIIHLNGSWNTTISTTTKLLHFTFPNLFPIYDSRIHNSLFGGKYKTYKNYQAYVLAIMIFLNKPDIHPYIREQAVLKQISLIRFVEMVLFASVSKNK